MDEHIISVHDRGADQTSLIYPVVSRRSGGLSVGINLFPDRKRCNFDCPYCEVRPFAGKGEFAAEDLEAQLDGFFLGEYKEAWAPQPVRDLCVSGNGEPTLSAHLWEALELCAEARHKHSGSAGSAPIVIITNATGFLDKEIRRCLAAFARREPLKIWAKLDAGDQEGFAAMSRSGFDLDAITVALAEFSREAPTIVQTMLCRMRGKAPESPEALAYASRVNSMLEAGAVIEAIHLYTLARAPTEPWVGPVSDENILRFMRIVSETLIQPLPLLGFGESGERLILQA
ncbi:MAG: hypothetical protein WC820_06460 [Spirochaetales bacterium]|jgi:histidinol dehydrogenase